MNDQPSYSHPLKAIASKFETQESRFSRSGTDNASIRRDGGADLPCPPLSSEFIKAPALLIDDGLRIVWQNNAARTRLWGLPEAQEHQAAEHLFDLLLHPTFRQTVANWKDWSSFFLRQVQPLATSQEVQQILEQWADTEREWIAPLSKMSDAAAGPVNHILRRVAQDGSIDQTFRVVGTTFDQGRLLVFEEIQEEEPAQRAGRETDLRQRLALVQRHPLPVRVVFHVIAARLNNADTLRSEMLDEEYSRLLQRLWGKTLEVIEESGGIVTPYVGDGLMGIFLPAEHGSDQSPLDVIQCALELKKHMEEIGREWRIRKGWLHDLELNIGIDSGNDYVVDLPSALGDNLVTSGEAVQLAGYLARLAANGQIWTTKTVISQIPSNELNTIRFGIFRNDNHRRIFVSRSFARLRELSPEGPSDAYGDLASRPVTQVFERLARE